MGKKDLRKAIFLDRDGVINVDNQYVYKVENFKFIDGIFDFLREAQRRGYLLIIVTNQSGIGRGYYTLEDFKRVTEYMLETFKKEQIDIKKEQIFFCPHAPEDGCKCRKPNPGMILEAQKKFNIDLSQSFLIGDKVSDIEAGIRAGINNSILIIKNSRILSGILNGF